MSRRVHLTVDDLDISGPKLMALPDNYGIRSCTGRDEIFNCLVSMEEFVEKAASAKAGKACVSGLISHAVLSEKH